MSRKLYIHIGSHKTGTTSIQNALHRNYEILSKHKLHYFTKDQNGHDQHRFTLSSWFHKFSVDLERGYRIKDVEKLASSISSASENDIIVSAERFSFIFMQDELMELKKALKKYFDEIKIIVYLRRQDQQLLSQHNQASKFLETPEHLFVGSDLTALPKSKEHFKHYLDYHQKLSMWAKVFCKEKIIIRIFNKSELVNGDVVSDFLDLFDIKDFLEPTYENESNGFEKTKIGLLMNQVEIPMGPLRNIINRNLDSKNKLLPKREDAERFYEEYRNSNIALNKMFHISKDNEAIFNEDFSMYQEEGNELWAEESANATLTTIFQNLNETYGSFDYNSLFQAALKLEKNDVNLSYNIMKILNTLIPDNPNIKHKIKKYQRSHKL